MLTFTECGWFIFKYVLYPYVVLLVLSMTMIMFGDMASHTYLRYIPKAANWFIVTNLNVGCKLFGKKFVVCFERAIDYFFYKRNPILMIFYLFLVSTAHIAFIVYGWPMIYAGYVPSYHFYSSIATMVSVWVSWALSCSVSPGKVTAENAGSFRKIFKNGPLYRKKDVCPTCDVQKVPRSKHCSTCDFCVVRFDHHCPWINQCIGYYNHRWFILFLLTNVLMCVYSALLIGQMFWKVILKHKLFEQRFVDQSTGESLPASKMNILRYLNSQLPVLMYLWGAAFFMGIILIGFAAFHIRMALRNETSNEREKYSLFRKIGQEQYWKRTEKRRRDAIALTENAETPKNVENDEEPKKSGTFAVKNVYDRGLVRNLLEICWTTACNENKE
eukprot:99979_1